MNIGNLIGMVKHGTKAHSPVILSVVAGVGTVATAYLASRASFKAAKVIQHHEAQEGTPTNRKDRVKSRTGLVWKLYIPTALSTISTVGCIVGANRISAQKTLAAQAAFALSERAYAEYRDKVVQEFSARKDQAIHDKIAEEKVKDNPPRETFITGPGNILCCELYTGRYFVSDYEALRRAQNDLNEMMIHQGYATLDDLYDLLHLRSTQYSTQIGWDTDKLLELQFSTVLSEDDKPCIAFRYNYVKPL